MGTWPGDLDPHVAPELERSSLVVIDTQVDFIDGANPIPGTSEVLPAITRLLEASTGRRACQSCTSSGSTTATMSTCPAAP